MDVNISGGSKSLILKIRGEGGEHFGTCGERVEKISHEGIG